MEGPLLLQFSIALFTGMVAATLVPSVRRVVPRPVETILWVALVVVCVIGVLSIANPRARELTASAFWGVDQILLTLTGLMGAAVTGWLTENRFTLGSALLVAGGVDIMALAMLRSYRKGRAWQPRVRLYEWMELPRLPIPAAEPVAASYAVDELSRRWAAAMAVAGTALLAWLVNFLIWARDVLLPQQAARLARATAVGQVESRAGLEALRDTASELQFAAHAWFVAAGAPAVTSLATKATEAVRVMGGEHGKDGRPTPDRAVDLHVLVSALSLGWYGPLRPVSTVNAEDEEEDGESQQTGRLAS
ncbi:MAG TPA: hypothetical protein VNY77_01265 [Candidatus Angelobacter sp.]|nr:hypothetical protein [Candidatus Angelobacter sp.]